MKKIIIAFLILALLSLLVIYKISHSFEPTLSNYADQILTNCQKAENKTTCYETEIPKLMKDVSMEDSFKITSLVQEQDQTFVYCHVLGHELASLETRKDPNKWQDVVARCPAGVCSNGCVHGAFQERFREEAFSDTILEKIHGDLETVCEDRPGFDPSGLEQSSCYHALGHLLMYISGADIHKTIPLCGQLALKNDSRDFRRVCYDGAFMQIFQPLEAEDKALVLGKVPLKQDLKKYCFQFSDEVRWSCWNESWPMSFEEIITPQGAISFCSQLDKKGRDNCLTNIFYILPIQFRFETAPMNAFCNALAEERDQCFAIFATRLLEIDYKNKSQSIDFCSTASSVEGRDNCLIQLINYAGFVFHPGSSEYNDFCHLLPQNIKDVCLNPQNPE